MMIINIMILFALTIAAIAFLILHQKTKADSVLKRPKKEASEPSTNQPTTYYNSELL